MKRIIIAMTLLAFGAMSTMFSFECFAQSGSSAVTPAPSADSFETVKEYLLTSAARDFHENQPPLPAKFRKVRVGHIGDTSKSGSYRLCGEFLPTSGTEKAKWTGFATIKTSGYEQYIGSGTTYCSEKKIIWDTKDLSKNLKERLDAIEAQK